MASASSYDVLRRRAVAGAKLQIGDALDGERQVALPLGVARILGDERAQDVETFFEGRKRRLVIAAALGNLAYPLHGQSNVMLCLRVARVSVGKMPADHETFLECVHRSGHVAGAQLHVADIVQRFGDVPPSDCCPQDFPPRGSGEDRGSPGRPASPRLHRLMRSRASPTLFMLTALSRRHCGFSGSRSTSA